MFQIRPHERKNSAEGATPAAGGIGDQVDMSAFGDNVPKVFATPQNWRKRWTTMPFHFGNRYEDIYNFEVREDDVYVVTFPKSGTTWLQEAIWLLLNDLNYDVALSVEQGQRSIYLEMSRLRPKIPFDTVDAASKMKSPRLIKTHLPAHLMPRQIWDCKAKIVYCARNVKDVVVSYFNFTRGLGYWSQDMDDFVTDFINNDIMYTPYWENLLDFWELREESNVFFTTYEQMQRDLPAVLCGLCEFLQRPALTEEQMAKLVKHLSFENMKSNPCTNQTLSLKKTLQDRPMQKAPEFEYMRRGIVGAYKDELSVENQRRLDEWTEEHLKRSRVEMSDIFGDI